MSVKNGRQWLRSFGLVFLSIIIVGITTTESFAEALPEKYDPRELGLTTPVKKQPSGRDTCWTYITDAIESYLLKNGESTVLSENYYNYLIAENATGTYGENPYSTIISNGSDLDRGYSVSAPLDAIIDWKGPVFNEEFPDSITGYQPLNKWENLKESKHVQGIITIPKAPETITDAENEDRINKIKENVFHYGNANTSTYFFSSQVYNQNRTKADYRVANHYSTIVGWDDEYSRDKFESKPNKNGAFIVKNTWGSNWGYSGYYYISYEDWQVKLSEINTISSVESSDNYDKKYNGAYSIKGASIPLDPGVKVTKAMTYSRDSNEDEQLSAISLRTIAENTKYEIYVSPDGKPNKGLSGFTKIQEGLKKDGGTETILLKKAVTLTGTEFSVAIVYQSTNDSKREWVPVSQNIAQPSLNAKAYSLDNKENWSEESYNKFFISAFTNKKNVVAAKSIIVDQSSLSLVVGDKETVHGAIVPKNATYQSIGYRSLNPEIVTVTSKGEVVALKQGESTIEVYSTKNPRLSKQINIKVEDKPKIQEIRLNQSEVALKENETAMLQATVYPEKVEKNIRWSSSNPNVCTVDQQGNLVAKFVGLTNITAKTEDGLVETSCQVKVNLNPYPEYQSFSSMSIALDDAPRKGILIINNPETDIIYLRQRVGFSLYEDKRWLEWHCQTENGKIVKPISYPDVSAYSYQGEKLALSDLKIEYTTDGNNYSKNQPSLAELEGYRISYSPKTDKGMLVNVDLQLKIDSLLEEHKNKAMAPYIIKSGSRFYGKDESSSTIIDGINASRVSSCNIYIQK